MKVTYWITTGLVTLVMSISGGMAVIHYPAMMKALAHLGYPSYFADLLGWGKMIGLVVLLVPGLPRQKEWVYAAFSITVLSGVYSHLHSGDGWQALDPLVTFVALVISYRTRPADRRWRLEATTQAPNQLLREA